MRQLAEQLVEAAVAGGNGEDRLEMERLLSMVEGRSAMRKLTSSMRAVFSARSMSRPIQNKFSAVRLSITSFSA
jgi:hypothetical protein